MKQTDQNIRSGFAPRGKAGISKELYVQIEEQLNLRKALTSCSNVKTLKAMAQSIGLVGKRKDG